MNIIDFTYSKEFGCLPFSCAVLVIQLLNKQRNNTTIVKDATRLIDSMCDYPEFANDINLVY